MDRTNFLTTFAAMRSRKEIAKELDRARKEFAKAKLDYDNTKAQADALAQKVHDSEVRMFEARNMILELGKYMQTMDLSGANAVRDRGEVKTYMVDGKEFHCANDGNDIRMTPYKEWKGSQNAAKDKTEEEDKDEKEEKDEDEEKKSKKKDDDEECLDCGDADDLLSVFDSYKAALSTIKLG